ncbi:DNA-nicking endonuclease, Smr domain [Sulfurivirga caldicuralii]|uniref:DNA-nicking endonuclease, Smr domain n=1 Tax=Sulfurivirga caldicuralii TaxID=364032 RepID=A0A1N6F8V3_9GAMM|nr:Smr/MutS family protein [Sulfurivirga caldicuralii]SIN91723.1 DNA-nicking endonuclease, Smr domain [Sulfurivirga caldicuralii]
MTTDNDKALFRKAMADVAPLKQPARVTPQTPRPRPRRKVQPPIEDDMPLQHLPEADPLKAWETPSGHVFWQRSSLRPQEVRRLKRGDFSKAWRIDLHGLTRDDAAHALRQFVVQAHHAGARHLLIITGKGYRSEGGESIVRKVAQQTLQQLQQVLAYTSAQPADGGTGALYVFLRGLSP